MPRFRRWSAGALGLAALGLLAVGAGSVITDAQDSADLRLRSTHFVDGKFQNARHQALGGWRRLWKMWRETERAEWPEWVDSQYGQPPASAVDKDVLQITVINHATVLIQGVGMNILTDPVYSKRVSPVSFVGPARVRNPGIRFEDLPDIDAVVISHDHYDHLDKHTLKKLIERDQPRIFAGLGVGRHLENLPNVTELDWWQGEALNDTFTLHFVPVQHFSGRGLFDRYSTLWGGYVLEFGAKKVYFGGDSGYAEHYQQTFERFGAMDVALLPIGAYAPRWFMGYVHMDPAQAVQAHQDLHAKKSIGIHYGTFQLTAEPINEPVTALAEAARKAGLAKSAFTAVDFGVPMRL